MYGQQASPQRVPGQTLNGTVKYPGNKLFPDKYNPGKFKQCLTIQLQDNTEEKIWYSQGKYPHAHLQKNDPVQILFESRDGKIQRRLIANPQVNQQANVINQYANQAQPLPGQQIQQQQYQPPALPVSSAVDPKAFITDYLNVFNKVYVYVENFVKRDDWSCDDVRAITTSIMITAQRENINLLMLPAFEQSIPKQPQQVPVTPIHNSGLDPHAQTNQPPWVDNVASPVVSWDQMANQQQNPATQPGFAPSLEQPNNSF